MAATRSRRTNKREFTTTEIARILGLSVRKIISYEERGYVSPSIQRAAGHGSKRIWSYEDAVLCTVTCRLAKFFTIQGIKNLLREVAPAVKAGGDVALFPPGIALVGVISTSAVKRWLDAKILELGW